jgi:hypothetical protein
LLTANREAVDAVLNKAGIPHQTNWVAKIWLMAAELVAR